MKTSKNSTREAWLERGVELMTKLLFDGYKVPKTRVSVGFTGHRGSKRVVGACWAPKASADNVAQIFIVPTQSDPEEVLAVLAHEMIHAIVGLKAGHRGPFRKCAESIGLTGSMRATEAGPELKKRLNDIIKTLGPFPHAKLTPGLSGVPKQGTRLIKISCSSSGYTVRITKKWLEQFGAPDCPCGCGDLLQMEEN